MSFIYVCDMHRFDYPPTTNYYLLGANFLVPFYYSDEHPSKNLSKIVMQTLLACDTPFCFSELYYYYNLLP